MESKLVIISFTLLFFNSAHAICVPRNASTPSPSPDTPPNLKPVSSSPKAPTPSSPKAPKPSSPKAPTPSSPAPKPSSPKAPTPSSPAPKPSSPKAPTPSSPKAPTPSSPAPKLSSPKAPTPSSPKAPTPASPAPKPSSPSPQQSPSLASSLDSSPSTPHQSLFKRPNINALTSAIPKLGGGGGNPGPAIKKICDSTDYPDVCLSTLGPLSGPAGDVPSILGFAIKAGLNFAKTALNTAEKLANKPGTSPDLASSFKDCKDSYDDVSYNFQNAGDALPKKDVGTMNTMLSAALTDVGDCQDAFEGEDSPLNAISDQLRKMASNCLAIVSLINK